MYECGFWAGWGGGASGDGSGLAEKQLAAEEPGRPPNTPTPTPPNTPTPTPPPCSSSPGAARPPGLARVHDPVAP